MSTLKCFMQTNHLEQAYKSYFEYLIQREKQFLKEHNSKESLSLHVYKTMQNFSLPKINSSVEITHNNDEGFPSCQCVIKRTIDEVILEFDKYQSENNVIIFKKEKNRFKITDLTEIM